MPTKRKTKVSKSKPARRPRVTSPQGPSYDTMMIIVVLLLLFVYPVGVIFMWSFMKTWPTWLKVIITLPFIISLLFVVLIMGVVGNAVRHNGYQQMMRKYQQQVTPSVSQKPFYLTPPATTY